MSAVYQNQMLSPTSLVITRRPTCTFFIRGAQRRRKGNTPTRSVRSEGLDINIAALCGAAAASIHVARRWRHNFATRPPMDQALGLESIFLTHYLCGMPRCIEAFRAVHATSEVDSEAIDILRRRGRQHLPSSGEWLDPFVSVYGSVANKLLSELEGYHPDLLTHSVPYVYGRVIRTSILSPVQLEMCHVGALSCAMMPRQLYGHIRGSFRHGITEREVRDIIDESFDGGELTSEGKEMALGVLEEVLRPAANEVNGDMAS